jgi:hypothetical protein
LQSREPYGFGQLASAACCSEAGTDSLTTSTQTSAVACLTADLLPAPASSQMWWSLALTVAEIVDCESTVDLQVATACAIAGLLAAVGEELLALVEELAGAVLVAAAGEEEDVEALELELEPPHPAIRTAAVTAIAVVVASRVRMVPTTLSTPRPPPAGNVAPHE